MQGALSEQQQPTNSASPEQQGHGTWAVSSPPSSSSLPHHLAAFIPSPPKVRTNSAKLCWLAVLPSWTGHMLLATRQNTRPKLQMQPLVPRRGLASCTHCGGHASSPQKATLTRALQNLRL